METALFREPTTPIERLPLTMADVRRYLHDTASAWSERRPEFLDLNIDAFHDWPFHPDLFRVENILQYQLQRAKNNAAPMAAINRLRQLILVVSTKLHEPLTPAERRKRSHDLWERSRFDPSEREQVNAALAGLQTRDRGDHMEPATDAMEELMGHAWRDVKSWSGPNFWKTFKKIYLESATLSIGEFADALQIPDADHLMMAVQALNYLRPLRDELYRRRLSMTR